MITRRAMLALLGTAAIPATLRANNDASLDSAFLRDRIDSGELPELAKRLPRNPRVIDLATMGREPGHHGGTLQMLIGRAKDIRYIPINSYSRLVGYNLKLELIPDILESYTVEEGRVFTFHLRPGHRWSDGSAFTSSDFEYFWNDVALNTDIARGGPPVSFIVNGEVAKFEVLDEFTVRYSWSQPNPVFLSKLASPIPQTLMLPAAYMRQFHANYQSAENLSVYIEQFRVDDWVGLHRKLSRQNRPENPDLPTLEAWRPTTAPPAEQFVFERNPYFHRVDENGKQLPYIDKFVLNVSSSEIIAAKTATGDSDLQGVGLALPDYTLIKEAENRFPIKVSLWRRTQGSSVALYPNLNCRDDVWRPLFQDVRVRRALSLAIDRKEINQVLYYGLARESSDTVLPESPLYKESYAKAWSYHDPDQANQLFDEAGLSKRNSQGIRLLPDGRRADIIVESPGESTLQTDVLELITDHYRQVGISVYIRSSQRDIFRSRTMGGNVQMSVFNGMDNGLPSADMPPTQMAPSNDDQLQWPLWGLHYMSAKKQGHASDMPYVQQLSALLEQWMVSTSTEQRTDIWTRMLTIYTDQVFSIGTVNGGLQPLARSARLNNIPDSGLYGFAPTSYLGVYMPDTFWFDKKG